MTFPSVFVPFFFFFMHVFPLDKKPVHNPQCDWVKFLLLFQSLVSLPQASVTPIWDI